MRLTRGWSLTATYGEAALRTQFLYMYMWLQYRAPLHPGHPPDLQNTNRNIVHSVLQFCMTLYSSLYCPALACVFSELFSLTHTYFDFTFALSGACGGAPVHPLPCHQAAAGEGAGGHHHRGGQTLPLRREAAQAAPRRQGTDRQTDRQTYTHM